jgi:hypothetical protein
MISQAIEQMEEEIESMKAYMVAKIRSHDFHAVSDAANDCRELVAKLEILRQYVTPLPQSLELS